VRRGGSWVVLGVGPGKTTRTVETDSPVDSILAERGAKHVNVNLLRYFFEPATLDGEAKAFLQRGLGLAMEWAVQGLVRPHIGRTIDSTVEAINAGLQSLKAGAGTLGKVAVVVDPDRVRLAQFGFRLRERFLYEYDFYDGWQHDVRLEKVLPLNAKRLLPVCTGGQRPAPPEDCGGARAYREEGDPRWRTWWEALPREDLRRMAEAVQRSLDSGLKVAKPEISAK
jgi:hypothetical protein